MARIAVRANAAGMGHAPFCDGSEKGAAGRFDIPCRASGVLFPEDPIG